MGYIRERRESLARKKFEREHATVALAGWRIVARPVHLDGAGYVDVYAPNGHYHGYNRTMVGAVRYAWYEMMGNTNAD